MRTASMLLVAEQLFPIGVRARYPELVRGAPARFERPVRDGDDFHAGHLAQARNVHRAYDAARADDPDANLVARGRRRLALLRE